MFWEYPLAGFCLPGTLRGQEAPAASDGDRSRICHQAVSEGGFLHLRNGVSRPQWPRSSSPRSLSLLPLLPPWSPASPAVSLSSGIADLWRWGWMGEKKAEDPGRVGAVFLEGFAAFVAPANACQARLSYKWLTLWAISTGRSVLGSVGIELNFHATVVQELNLATDPERYTSLPTFLFPEILPQSFERYLFQEAFLTTPSAGDSLSWMLWGVYWLASTFNSPCLFLQEC